MQDTYLEYLINKIKVKKLEEEHIRVILSEHSAEFEEKMLELMEEHNLQEEDYLSYCKKDVSEDKNDDISDLQDIYKELLVITHPDKGNCENGDIFIKITECYQKKDYLTLMEYANKYSSDKINLTQFKLILERQYSALKNNVKNLRLSLGYDYIINNNLNSMVSFIKLISQNKKLKLENEIMKQRIKNIENKNA